MRGGTKKGCLTLVYRFFCPLKMPATNLIKVSMLEIAASITNSTIIYHVSFKILECLRQVFVELIQEVCVFIYLFIVLSFIVYFLHVLQAASSFKFSFIYSLQTVTVILKLLFLKIIKGLLFHFVLVMLINAMNTIASHYMTLFL